MKIAIIAGIVILIAIGVLISPAFVVIEADEASPLETQEIVDNSQPVQVIEEPQPIEVIEVEEPIIQDMPMPSTGPQVLFTGEFSGTPGHPTSGEALYITTEEGDIVRFEDFSTINGPGLHIYLATDKSATDYIDLGPIQATRGNVNYDVPEGVDLDKYTHVLVWCEPFGVLFGYSMIVPAQ